MFEQYTYESLLDEMLLDTKEEFDTTETSLLYASYAKTAARAADAYRALDRVLELVFVATSEGDYLKMRTAEMDVVAEAATPAVRSGTFNVTPPVDSRFFVNDVYFKVIQEEPVLLECETPGTIGNTVPEGSVLLPLETINGLETAILGETLILGQDEEAEEALKLRYEERVTDPVASGNAAHYREWAKEVNGVGAVKVFPNWDGADTVKVVIVDEDLRPASALLVEQAQNYIDPVPGMGEGQAPAGAFVTVTSATALTVNITATVEISSETTLETVKAAFLESLNTYLKKITFQEGIEPVIRSKQVGSLLFNIEGVIDYTNLLINGQTNNVTLTDTQAPVIGTVTLSV
ncbi:baseplate J/gp47 family protein [Domibacillus sp.]|uniref:baseplate J/gp47 family protein n=1 Tax=Domibacillus sp. TaxID=1969783 RepID=UPI00281152EC|nr:baseplate J/gp47 family protein [Domibacillus sp.]